MNECNRPIEDIKQENKALKCELESLKTKLEATENNYNQVSGLMHKFSEENNELREAIMVLAKLLSR